MFVDLFMYALSVCALSDLLEAKEGTYLRGSEEPEDALKSDSLEVVLPAYEAALMLGLGKSERQPVVAFGGPKKRQLVELVRKISQTKGPLGELEVPIGIYYPLVFGLDGKEPDFRDKTKLIVLTDKESSVIQKLSDNKSGKEVLFQLVRCAFRLAPRMNIPTEYFKLRGTIIRTWGDFEHGANIASEEELRDFTAKLMGWIMEYVRRSSKQP
jgi:hypothetical protein